ncbi:hypothetical protein EDI_009820 [Entamoeba dispar SAW760]|uniref:Uncharacterized protein n=1 Tax=Entamoeba dispar (strain ATCC PRA-260 / SAW760) TaxID=370354 RepID=B0EG92_ENTDS|nr:uncharacterized protein EDI_009820 [Entamoeba dispar SAW760]XP_001739636.1 uncharacterized protein EDI_187210 [Entamoeba dispar SAW760]EDR23993.1 hypothetical protein EDI_187210 [Entamoeba dispar SAW760]EDR26469.1 hypothetical protein EDI_009820 [Entamoeba dispar SAW760]|eukprot:EDR23993.1 hypothetical protein EDI_187210 [Entamoeba dispar SAW760]
MSLSQFTPVDCQKYYVISSNSNKSTEPRTERDESTKPNIIKERKYKKKRWDPQLKIKAIKKAEELGLTHATNHLQKTYPELYSDLCPSTLQYWVQQSNIIKKKIITA